MGMTAQQANLAQFQMFGTKSDLVIFFKKQNYYSGMMGAGTDKIIAILRDPGQIKNLYFNSLGKTQKSALLPMNITITTLGVAGISIGEAVQIPYISWMSNNGYWQISDFTHKIDDNKWEVDIEFRFRVKFN